MDRLSEKKMKTCYACKGKIVKKNMDVEILGVMVHDVPVEICERCGEIYFTTPAATFIQKVAKFVENEKKELIPTPL